MRLLSRLGQVPGLVLKPRFEYLNQWLDYARDIRADFMHAFGESPGAQVGIAIMTDSDSTQTTAHAWYGPVQLEAAVLARTD